MSASHAERLPAAPIPAPALVIGGILSVQVGSAIAHTLFDEVGAAGATLLRLGFAAILLLAILRPRLHTWTGPQWRAAALLGISMGTMNLLFYQAIRTVPLGPAVTVEFLGPLLLALVQTRRWSEALWAVLAGVGVVLLGLGSPGGAELGGLALAFGAGLCWAGYILSSASVGRVLPGIDGLAAAVVIGTLIALPFGAAGAARAFDDPGVLLAAAAVAVLSSVLPYGLELSALRRIPTRVFGILMSLEPAAAALAGLVVLGQALVAREVVALVLVSVASLGVTLSGRAAPESAPPATGAPDAPAPLAGS